MSARIGTSQRLLGELIERRLAAITTANEFHTDMGTRLFVGERIINSMEKNNQSDYPFVAYTTDGANFETELDSNYAHQPRYTVYAYGWAETMVEAYSKMYDLLEDVMTALNSETTNNAFTFESFVFYPPEPNQNVLIVSVDYSASMTPCLPNYKEFTWLT